MGFFRLYFFCFYRKDSFFNGWEAAIPSQKPAIEHLGERELLSDYLMRDGVFQFHVPGVQADAAVGIAARGSVL